MTRPIGSQIGCDRICNRNVSPSNPFQRQRYGSDGYVEILCDAGRCFPAGVSAADGKYGVFRKLGKSVIRSSGQLILAVFGRVSIPSQGSSIPDHIVRIIHCCTCGEMDWITACRGMARMANQKWVGVDSMLKPIGNAGSGDGAPFQAKSAISTARETASPRPALVRPALVNKGPESVDIRFAGRRQWFTIGFRHLISSLGQLFRGSAAGRVATLPRPSNFTQKLQVNQ